MTEKYETHEHDVLVIGAGGAGLRAAIEALGSGARVGQSPRDSKTLADGPGITTVGKNAQIPAGIRIARGAVVAADASPDYFLRAAPVPPTIAKKRDTAS